MTSLIIIEWRRTYPSGMDATMLIAIRASPMSTGSDDWMRLYTSSSPSTSTTLIITSTE